MSHYEQRLEKDLDNIRSHVRTLSGLASEALENALQSLRSGNRKLAYATILGDARINAEMRDVEALCHLFIARHLPSAGHLRLMSSIIRTSLQLERLGDYAVTIAREGVQLASPPDGVIAQELEMIADQSLRMLGHALDAFNEGNAEKAQTAMDLGASMEITMDGIYADLVQTSDASRIKSLLALFVVFNMVKRISDQAKNICEETLFAVLGKTKPARVHDVLFLDEDNACLGPMAEAIGNRGYAGSARFSSAGCKPAQAIDSKLGEFLGDFGFDLSTVTPRSLDPSPNALSKYFVIVSLDGSIDRLNLDIPFHCSVLEWDIGARPAGLEGEALKRRFEELYRELSSHVRDLVETLRGEDAS